MFVLYFLHIQFSTNSKYLKHHFIELSFNACFFLNFQFGRTTKMVVHSLKFPKKLNKVCILTKNQAYLTVKLFSTYLYNSDISKISCDNW